MRETSNLGGTSWQFGQVPHRPFDAPHVDDRVDVVEWLPATVPGNVRSDLLALRRIPDPFLGDYYRASLPMEDWDWWYRRSLDLSIGLDQRVFLIFEGIDYLSAVFVNGQELGRHEGMFSRQVYEITDALRTQTMPEASPQTSRVSASLRTVEIAVRIWGSSALPPRRLNLLEQVWGWLADHIDPTGMGAFPDRMATVKCQMSFGWDFAPPIRAMGIWDEGWLVVTDGVFIEDVYVKSQISKAQPQTAYLTAQVIVDSDRSRLVQARVQVHPANFDGPAWGPGFFELDLSPGRSIHSLSFDLPHPQLWEPWDRGLPHLYELTLSVLDHSSPISLGLPASPPCLSRPLICQGYAVTVNLGRRQDGAGRGAGNLQSLDSVSTRFGVRSITLDNWTFILNGRREFIRGVNWVPADSLPGRLQRDDYADLLGMAREAGVNLVRVWGGGLREKRAFYDLCDELGLLVWQEFPFACSFLGYFPRNLGWLRLVERESTAIVQAMRNHPSLLLWCGGNELSPRRNRPLVTTLARVVEAHDGTRPFVPASPSPGDAHNWDVWHGKYPPHAYRREKARFLSEFGLQAAPANESLAACLPEAEVWPPGAGWVVHHAELGKLWRYVGVTLSLPGRGDGGEGKIAISLEEFITASQQAQALGLQIAIEHMRRRKGETGGLCLWQFNEPWPAISWAIVDYWRRPKLAYQRLKDLYNPVLVGLTFSPARYGPGDTLQAEVWAVNDSLETLDDCWLLIELDSVKIYQSRVILLPDSAQTVGVLRHRFESEPCELELVLHRGDRVIARNIYDLSYYDPSRIAWKERLVRRLADITLR